MDEFDDDIDTESIKKVWEQGLHHSDVSEEAGVRLNLL